MRLSGPERRNRHMKDTRGFTVVEVLIAAAILAISLLAIASMFPSGYENVQRSGKQTAEVTLAQQRIEWLRNQGYTAAALNAGTTTETLPGYTRTTTIVDDLPMAGVKQVTVRVTADAVGGGGVELRSLIAQ